MECGLGPRVTKSAIRIVVGRHAHTISDNRVIIGALGALGALGETGRTLRAQERIAGVGIAARAEPRFSSRCSTDLIPTRPEVTGRERTKAIAR